jgi:hypothetical protein
MNCSKCGEEVLLDEGYETVGRCINPDCVKCGVAVSTVGED